MTQYTDHDLEVNERLTRLEGKIDILLTNSEDQKGQVTNLNGKTSSLDQRITYLETEKRIYKRIIAPISHILTGSLGALITKLFTHG